MATIVMKRRESKRWRVLAEKPLPHLVVKKKKVCQQGKETSVDCPFEEEFKQALDILHVFSDPKRKYVLPALILLAIQMIAWLNDTSHLWKSTLM
eukprot:12204124-Ditylum_brightwellii.AAC.1